MPGVESRNFLKALTDRCFRPLTEHEERTHGWVSPDNLLVTDFSRVELVKGSYAAFALREDRRRVNARLLRAHVELELEAARKGAADGSGQGRISRDERKRIREDVQQRLLAQTSPSVDAWTVLLQPRKKIVYVLTLSARANELIRAHFLDSFGAELLPLTPWRRSLELLDDAEDRKRLEQVHRTEFFAPGAERVDLAASLGVAPAIREAGPQERREAMGLDQGAAAANRVVDPVDEPAPTGVVADEAAATEEDA